MSQSLLAAVKALAGWIADSWYMLKLTFFSALFVLIGCASLVWLPQGVDLLRALADQSHRVFLPQYFRLNQLFFVMASLSWALAAWYCARVLASRRVPNAVPDTAFQLLLRIWLPRVYGAVALFAVACGFYKAAQNSWAIIYLIITLLFVVCSVMRRDRLANFAGSATHQIERLHPHTTKLIYLSIALSFVLFALFVWRPVESAQIVGAQAIALFALTSWTIFGSFVLVLLPKIYAWPSMALLPALLIVFFSPFNDNHAPRQLADKPEQDCSEGKNNPRCQNVAEHFSAWLKAKQKTAPGSAPYPVYIVAAEGGGIRAAYWTAAILAQLHDANPVFSEHVYAISGVSGGALGAAVYAALLNEKTPRCAVTQTGGYGFSTCVEKILVRDFLAPILAYSFYPDQMQRLLPVAINSFDRARALEFSWEYAWEKEMGNKQFSTDFLSLWSQPFMVPALFLNGTVVETGERFIMSNLRAGETEFKGAIDGMDNEVQNQHSRLSTAVNFSTRFTLLSPAARLTSKDKNIHIVDGGYHDNTGAITATDILRVLQKVISSRQLNAYPVVLVLRNEAEKDKKYIGADFLGEFWHPLQALFQARNARGEFSLEILKAAAAHETQAKTYFVLRPSAEEASAPLGWVMSQDTLKKLKDGICSSENQDLIKMIAQPTTTTENLTCRK